MTPSASSAAVRKDCGKVSLDTALADRLVAQYREYPHWSYKLHHDNLHAAREGQSFPSGRSAPIPRSGRYMHAARPTPKPTSPPPTRVPA